MFWRDAVALGLSLALQTAAYDIVREYSGSTFFDRWDFYGSWDNLTLGVSSSPPCRQNAIESFVP